MKRFNPFFTIGTFGIIITAILHILLALGLPVVTNHTAFIVLYPGFIAFIIIGIALTVKKQKETETD
ncbi:MAG TPA: hypothetical protein VLZ33_08040 [Dysgonamonadaceae bacterium]|nr:hypothetical protein [Dysgonamonadaceae bacterium]